MGENIKTFSKEAKNRWRAKMPKFFNRVCWVCSLISGTALAANEAMQLAGATPHEWWTDLFPYLVGIPAGMAFASRFTQAYGNDGTPITYDNKNNERKERTILDKDNF